MARREIGRSASLTAAEAQDALAAATRAWDLGRGEWARAPIGFRSPLLEPVLGRLGLRYVSWTRRGLDTGRADPARVLERLTGEIAPGDVLLLHDDRPGALAVLPALLERLAELGLKCVSLPAACSRS